MKKTTGSNTSNGNLSGGSSKLISRWGELENSRSVAPRGVGFTTNLGQPMRVKTFIAETPSRSGQPQSSLRPGRLSGHTEQPQLPLHLGQPQLLPEQQTLKSSAPLKSSKKGKVHKISSIQDLKRLQNKTKAQSSGKTLSSLKLKNVKNSTDQTKSNLKTNIARSKPKITHLSAGNQKGSLKKKASNKQQDRFLIAIWGLIGAVVLVVLLLVFCVFLPKVQKDGRESARVQDMVKISNAVVRYQRDHSGNRMNLPAPGSWVGTAEFPADCAANSACSFVQEYLNDSDDVGIDSNGYVEDYKNHFKDPDGTYYNLVITENLATTKNVPKVFSLDAAAGSSAQSSEQAEVTGAVLDETSSADLPNTEGTSTGAEQSGSGSSDVVSADANTEASAVETTTSGIYTRPESLSYNGEGYEFIPARDMAGKTTGLSHTIYIVPGAKCRGELIVKATRNSFAVVYNFEDGARCLSNN